MKTVSMELEYKLESIGQIDNGDYVDEYFKITAISGTTVTLNSTIKFFHYGNP